MAKHAIKIPGASCIKVQLTTRWLVKSQLRVLYNWPMLYAAYLTHTKLLRLHVPLKYATTTVMRIIFVLLALQLFHLAEGLSLAPTAEGPAAKRRALPKCPKNDTLDYIKKMLNLKLHKGDETGRRRRKRGSVVSCELHVLCFACCSCNTYICKTVCYSSFIAK